MKRLLPLLLSLLFIIPCDAQFFGRNKPRYRSFDFKIRQTPHYDLYYYMKNKETIDRLAQWSEMWYDHHKAVFKDEIEFQNPIMIYNNHADFQQNNAISGALSPGTGGVTEAFKNRVVMPITFTHQQTNHVLGHELVHAFQFNNIVRGDSTSLGNLGNLPLWMSEGLAEYLSLGSEDSHTALWMRDAVTHDDIPTLTDLSNGYQYFPYRYGHALWSFITGHYGDDVVGPLYNGTSIKGQAGALDSLLSTNEATLSGMWASSLKTYYEPLLEGRSIDPPGRDIITPDNSGNINVSPVISPNGRYVVFLSERDLISTDLFLADARTGEVIKKLVSVIDGAADHLNYLESAGSWSPDSKEFVYVVFKKGKNALVIVDVESGDTKQTLFSEKVPAITNPAWSTDGKSIVFTGKVEGQVDLFSYSLSSGRTTQLTDDIYSEIGASFSPDGSKIVFSYDKRSFDGETYDGMYTLDLAVMDMESQEITLLDVFHGADNINPTYDNEGNILFLSDPDGFRDLYQYNTSTDQVLKLTNLKTGITGITRYSPAISASRKTDRVMCTVYKDRKYSLHRMKLSSLQGTPVEASSVNKIGALLPYKNEQVVHYVDENLGKQSVYPFISTAEFKNTKYRPQFKLDYIGGGAGVGVSNNSFSGNTNLQGGVQMLFSDILGNNQLFANVALNGELLDFGTQLSYINRTNRLAYGFGIGHIPQRTGFQNIVNDVVTIDNQEIDVVRRDLNIIRLFNESLNAFVHFPFSTTLRLEGGLSGFYQHFRQDLQQDFFATNSFGQYVQIGQNRERVETGDQIVFNQFYTLTKGFGGGANLALVGDNSFFGLTGPIAGHRFRLSVESQFGIDNYVATLADARKYWFLKPITIAVRGLSYNRYERETNTVYPLFVGNMGFVRGFDDVFQDASINPTINFDRMIGSKIAMVSGEVRIPFLGPKQLALIGSPLFFTDLVFFGDVGTSFDSFDQLQNGRPTQVIRTDEEGNIVRDNQGFPIYELQTVKPLLAASAGISLRVNVGNVLILEPYYARQLVSNGRWDFGLNFIPGW